MQVWENLSLKDMARAAGTCKDFAMQAKETRSDLRTLKLPPGAAPCSCDFELLSHCYHDILHELFRIHRYDQGTSIPSPVKAALNAACWQYGQCA